MYNVLSHTSLEPQQQQSQDQRFWQIEVGYLLKQLGSYMNIMLFQLNPTQKNKKRDN